MIERLSLGETAYFYHINTRLSNTFINKLFINISKGKFGRPTKIVNEPYSINNKDILYSLCIFKYKGKPNFLDETGSEEEIKYAYLLLIQYSNMLIINKKNISGLNTLLKDFITDVDYTTISRLFLSDSSSFEKLSMLNMDINSNSIRKRNMEANDLRTSFSSIYSSKYIINNIRIKDNNSRISLALNTSKINRLGKKVSIEEYFKWSIEVVDRVESFELSESYLDNFALPVNSHEILQGLKPASILFLFNELIDDFEKGLIEDVVYSFNQKEIHIDLHKYLENFNSYCDLELESSRSSYQKIKNTLDKNLKLRKNKTSLTISSHKLKNIILKYQSKDMNLVEYINKHQNFIVTFSDIEYVYTNKKLFRDTKLLGSLDIFLNVLEPYDSLNSITSEKGNYTSTSTSFDSNSLFFFIENTLATDVDYLFCDDLGNEFADFISIKNLESICFYHAKNGSSQLSASDFQVVLGQALKNIGNMNTSTTDLQRKLSRWKNNIKDTNISLKRVGDSVEKGGDLFIKTINSPNSIKEIYIVVNFLSKSSLEKGLINLKQGNSCPNQIIQILWLLSSFISTCKELGIVARISCLP
ncbi:hypothetical protein [Sporosarcina cyprini]|uniref:hypothetical protein n=1 Tax=Sporosarcina cyprini TaxID=2910523 RepID=UPI001EE0BF09|nr:hypothetical protein [Sporosarcina cyprini]MCG3087340.1 hypothetical protein [Sporosarcina cyprini]